MKKLFFLILLIPFFAYAQKTVSPDWVKARILDSLTVERATRATITDSLAEDIAYNKYSVNVKEYGAVGDGLTDDTEAIQSALDSGLPIIVFPPGYTFITDSLDMITSGQKIIATGSTIKLKDNATSENILTIKADSVIIDGGTWDGNRTNGNSRSQWDSWGIYIYGDYCAIKNTMIKNAYGQGIYYRGDFNKIYDNNFINCFFSGIASGLIVADTSYYCSVYNNNVDMSNGGLWGTGINVMVNIGHQIKDNVVILNISPDSTYTSGIQNLTGEQGVITGNIIRYGRYGITTKIDSSIISNNQIIDMVESGIGIEIAGGHNIVNGNVITQATTAIMSADATADGGGSIISNNKIISTRTGSLGMQLWGGAVRISNMVISNNYISAYYGLSCLNISKFNISDNIFDAGIIGSRAILLYPDSTYWNAQIFITGNRFTGGWTNDIAAYSTEGGDTVDNIFITNNVTDNSTNPISLVLLNGAVAGDTIINQYKISKDLYIDGNIISNGDSVLTMSDSVSVYATQNDISTFSSTVGTVTSVAAITLGTTGTDLSSTVANGTTTPVITLQVPTASATNRGALSSTDWSTFNNKPDSDAVNGLIGDWADSTASDTSAYTMDAIDSLLALVGKVQTHTITTDSTLAAGLMYGGIFYVTEAQTITLPAVAEGMNAVFITVGNVAVSIDVNGSDLMYLDGTALSDGDKATNTSTTGDMIVFTYFSSVGWYATSGSNDGDRWTDGN